MGRIFLLLLCGTSATEFAAASGFSGKGFVVVTFGDLRIDSVGTKAASESIQVSKDSGFKWLPNVNQSF